MAVTKIRKISSWTLLISFLISLVVLGMFYGGGAVDPTAEMVEPVYTGLLIDWMYALSGITIVATALFAIWQFINSLKADAKSAITGLVTIVLFFGMMAITYMTGNGTPLTGLNADSQAYNTEFWLKTTDMWIMSSIILIGLFVLVVAAGTVRKMLDK